MKRLSFVRWLALGCFGLVVSCKDVVRPDATGSIALHVIVPSEPASGGPERSPAQPAGHLTSATATATSGSTTKTITLTGGTATSNFTGTITGLAPGTYTVTVQGFVGTVVDYYGQTSTVSVTANVTSTATITFQSFVPTLNAFSPATTWSFRPAANITSVPNATSYIIEVDRSSTFPNPARDTVNSTTGASFVVSDTGTHYVRVRAANTSVPNGGNASATQSVRVTRDLRTSGDSVPAAPNLGFFATTTVTLDSLNIYPAADADWFSVSDCNGDSLILTAQAVRLTPPSRLNSVLLVYNAAGRLVAGNDDGDSTDARVAMLISTDGAYKVRVSGTGNTVGHYRLRIQARAGANNTGTTCRVVALPVTSVAAGYLHTCAVQTTTGNTDCWGNNADGQLGNGTTTITSSPTRVSGTQVLQTVTAGRFHSCGRTSGNVAYCWGYNGDGQLGDNSTTSRSTPVAVSTTQLFQYVGAGAFFTCGLTTGGSAYCWGDNGVGQLGNGTTTSSSVPVLVSGGWLFQSLAVGYAHACGATSAGTVYCWGANGSGQLGNGTTTNSSLWVQVLGGLILQGVVAGTDHTCARTNPGNAAYCWGSNSDAQLGDGSFTDQTTPVAVQGALAFTALAGGGYHTCGLVSGTAYCWGNNFDGQLGDGTTSTRTAPTLVAGGLTFQALSGGSWHTCGVRTTTGGAYCWGWNGFGQNGNGFGFDHTGPVPISGGLSLRSISTNNQHSCGITTGNAAYCWGANVYGELGDASYTDRLTPVAVSGAGTYQSVTTGREHSCALTSGSAVACWGLNDDGQLGDGTVATRNTPLAISGTYQSVTAGAYHTCALSTTTVYCWGYNFDGQLGNGTTTNASAPVAVAGSYSAVAAGAYHSCAVRATGGLIDCWGENSSGQLGNGTLTNRNTPGVVSGSQVYQSATAGNYHTCALTTAGAAYCWGYNGSGQLGDGSTTDRTTPVAVSGGLTFQSLNAGNYHTCGITAANVAYCWGENFTGQVGNGGFSDRNAPTLVAGLIAFQGVDAGGAQTCGFSTSATSGRGYCWGNNERGQLGNGTLTVQTSPAIVVTGPAAAPLLATGGYSAQEDSRWSRQAWPVRGRRPWDPTPVRRQPERRQP